MTDDEKHALAKKRGLPHAVFLPRSLYEQAKREGFDMDVYVIQKPIPIATNGEQ